MTTDTICAVATPAGEGGVGIVRVSGEKAVEVASSVVRLRCGRPLAEARSHRLYHADLLEGPAAGRRASAGADAVLDEALVAVMRAPRSYTGETVVEVQCHGAPVVLQLLCEGLVCAGARLAEPGEFTKRAFLNGRLDLAQAEGVLDTIRARTEGALRIAQEQRRGALSRELDGMRNELIGLLAEVEAGIDFAEEDLTFIGDRELAERIQRRIGELARLTESCREGRMFREGLATAIVGRPNVGKSSLLNALVRTDRAIVTAIPGTTRDVLEEMLNVRGLAVRLLDTAGIHQAGDPIEREGIRRSRSAMEAAEFLLLVVDGSMPLGDEDRELIARHPEKHGLVVINKTDLPRAVGPAEIGALLQDRPGWASVSISAKTGEGLDELRDRLRGLAVRAEFEPGESATVTRLRHQSALARAKEALEHAWQTVTGGMPGECVAMDLRAATEALGEITGAVTTDDILDRVFREFCIGK